LTLTKFEQQNPVWLKLKSYLEEELLRLRALNDKMVSEVSTAETRGRIAQIKDLLRVEDEPPDEVVPISYAA
jgi:hypothetical protein